MSCSRFVIVTHENHHRLLCFPHLDQADSVTLTASATTVAAGTTVTLTCTANGGNPRPGLELYRQPGNQLVKRIPQPSGQAVAQLVYTRTLNKEDNQARYVCRTLVTSTSIPNFPVKSSTEITFDVQCEYFALGMQTFNNFKPVCLLSRSDF